MKKTIIMKASLFALVMVLLMPLMYAQKREILSASKIERREFGKGDFDVEVTYYYYDTKDKEVKHGVSTAKIADYEKKARSTIKDFNETVNYFDGKRNGKYSRTVEFIDKQDRKVSLKIAGEYENDQMSGNWTFNSVVGKERINATFTVKDGAVINFSDGSTSFSVDANGKASLSGKPYISGKNNVITGTMHDSGGNLVAASLKAKALIDAMVKGDVSTKECVEAGFTVSEIWVNNKVDWLRGHADHAGGNLFGFYDVKGLKFPVFSILHEIVDGRWLRYSECISELEAKKGNVDEFAKAVNDMLDDNCYYWSGYMNYKYIDANTARKIEQYVASYLSTLANSIKQTIQNSNTLTDLVSYMNNQGNIMSLLDQFDQNDKQSIESLYASKSAELQKAASLRIKDEMLQKQSTKELKQYYEGQKSTISLLPDASSIKTEYENTYNKLQKVEEEAAKKAARKQKIITGVKWVGGAVVIVGGYILAKRYGFFDK